MCILLPTFSQEHAVIFWLLSFSYKQIQGHFSGKCTQGSCHSTTTVKGGGLRTGTRVLPNSPRTFNTLVKVRVLKSHVNRTLHLWFFSMQDFKWPSLTKRYNQLVLTAFIKIFNSVFPSIPPPLPKKTRLKTKKNKFKKKKSSKAGRSQRENSNE